MDPRNNFRVMYSLSKSKNKLYEDMRIFLKDMEKISQLLCKMNKKVLGGGDN